MRIHYGSYDPAELIEFIRPRAEIMLSVIETDSARPHIHSVIVGFKQTVSTFRQQFLKKYPALEGNGSYSLKKKDDLDAQLRYVSKGEGPDKMPFVLVCAETVDVKEFHKRYWEVNLELKQQSAGPPAEGASVKIRSQTWTEKTRDAIMSELKDEVKTIVDYWRIPNPDAREVSDYRTSRMIVFRFMMKRLGVGAKKIGPRICKEMFDGFLNCIIHSDMKAGDAFADDMFNQIYP